MRGLPLLWWLSCLVPWLFSAGLPLPCSRPARRLLLLCLVRSALPPVAFVFVLRCRGLLAVCAALLSRFFVLSCLTSSSQNSFHLSLRPRRASTFFRKESRQRFAKELRPFEPHSCALRPIYFSSALLAGLTALRAANRRLIWETLEKPRSRAQLFKCFCAKEDVCTLSPIPPLSRCWPAYAAFRPQTAG